MYNASKLHRWIAFKFKIAFWNVKRDHGAVGPKSSPPGRAVRVLPSTWYFYQYRSPCTVDQRSLVPSINPPNFPLAHGDGQSNKEKQSSYIP